MVKIERSALVMHPADHMFRLVSDVESYPHYMDGCVGSEILERYSESDLLVRLDLSRMGIKHSFVTRNRLSEPHQITMNLAEGPFRSLAGEWSFLSLSKTASKISLNLSVDFENTMLASAASRWFESIANELVDSMCKRANHVAEQATQ